VLFAFDKLRMAILLVGGDKSDNWSRWYETNIPIADERFTMPPIADFPQCRSSKFPR
jgi:hypothetical protein